MTGMKNQQTELTTSLTILMAIATGLVVASNYYAQPLLETIAVQFNLTTNMAGFIVTTAQLGYAAGLLFLVPLGDLFERKRLILIMTLLSAIGLLITALSNHIWQILLGTALTGLFSVVAQILIPMAASIAKPHQRGKAVGIIMSGLLLGILLARTVSGAVAMVGGWRAIYWVAFGLLMILLVVLAIKLPRYQQKSNLNYFQLIYSIGQLFCSTPVFAVRALLGALSFANFALLWTAMAFLLASPPFNYSEGTIGLFGLVGAAGALMASQAGHLVDKGKGKRLTTFGLILLLLSWIPIGFAQYSLTAFIIGVLILDLAVQAVHVTSQSTLYRILPDARNRLTAGYMTSYFIGGALGSLLSGYAYEHAGWAGVAISGIILTAISLIVWAIGIRFDPTISPTDE